MIYDTNGKILSLKKQIKKLEEKLSDSNIFSDIHIYKKLQKKYKKINFILNELIKYKLIEDNINENKELIRTEEDKDICKMAYDEIINLNKLKIKQENIIKNILIPKEYDDDKNVIFEIRSGTGGDEAALFVEVLYRIYLKFSQKRGWKIELINATENSYGGYKEIILNISGNGVYGVLKFESGVHRVQRVPLTETQGRVHTSAASIAVLPEPENIDVNIKESDLRKDTFCSSGPGGQSVNTTYSAIRLVHIPTGITVQCQDEKSQIKNYDKALKVLKARVYELNVKDQQYKISEKRKNMILTGDRSEKIRTYNFPQGRVTDHRLNMTVYNIESILDGNIDDLIEKIKLFNSKDLIIDNFF